VQATDLAPSKHDIQEPARCLAAGQAIHHRGLTGGITTARERRNDCVWLGAPKDIGARTITLPLFPAMADADVDRVCDAVATVMAKLR